MESEEPVLYDASDAIARITLNRPEKRNALNAQMLDALKVALHRADQIAAVRGRALAGGCGLATACDIVLAARSARFGYPEVKLGFVPAMVMAILRRNVSEKKAFELLTLGDEIGTDQALELGLINHVFEEDEFAEKTEAFGRRFQRVSRSAVSLSKRLLYQIDGMTFEDALQCGSDTNVIARMTEDCQQGIKRFLAKS